MRVGTVSRVTWRSAPSVKVSGNSGLAVGSGATVGSGDDVAVSDFRDGPCQDLPVAKDQHAWSGRGQRISCRERPDAEENDQEEIRIATHKRRTVPQASHAVKIVVSAPGQCLRREGAPHLSGS